MIDTRSRTAYTDEHALFRDQVRRLIDRDLVPNMDRWERAHLIDREFWRTCGAAGLLCPTVPEAYGGPGLDFSYNAIVDEELGYAGFWAGLSLHSDIVADYIVAYGSEEQKKKYLPGMVSGDIVAAIAMTEPGAGSDLQGIATTARRDGGDFVINGSKIYITNGYHCDIVVVVAKTDPAARGRGMSLIIVEADTRGFERGRNLDKIGQHHSDTLELFFHDVRVPASNLLGKENAGFGYLKSQLSQERLSIAVLGQAAAQRAFEEGVRFTRDRKAFGKTVLDFQNTRFTLADLAIKLQVGWAHIDWAIRRHVAGELTPEEGAAAKAWHTDLQFEAADIALQLHGGAGYMNEYPIARFWRDARVPRIYGGTNEIMKEIVGRALSSGV